jgi:quinol monooxygenase YgiN
MSVVVVATIYPLPEHRDEVIGIFEATIAQVHAEDEGCELYALHEGRDRLVMIEKWASRDALKAHETGAALTAAGPKLAGKLSAPVDVQVLQPHPAGVAGLGTV